MRVTCTAWVAYLWHNGLSILVDYVTEGHLSALVRVCANLWMVDVRNLFNRDCTCLVGFQAMPKR
jgi:hypothetical protein